MRLLFVLLLLPPLLAGCARPDAPGDAAPSCVAREAWRAALPPEPNGWGFRKVAYAEDRVVVAGGDPGARSLNVSAVALDGSGTLWNATLAGVTANDLRVKDGRVVLATYDPEAEGGALGRMLGLDAATGEVLWERPPRPERPWQVVGAAAEPGAPIVVLAGSTLEGVDARTGAPAWSRPGDHRPVSVLRADDATAHLFVSEGDGAGNVTAVDLASGRERWSVRASEYPVALRGADPLVVVGRRSAVALDAETGEEAWRSDGFEHMGVLDERLAYRSEASGLVAASDLRTGEEAWRFQAASAAWYPAFSDEPRHTGPGVAQTTGGVLLEAANETRGRPKTPGTTQLWMLDEDGALRWTAELEGKTYHRGRVGDLLLHQRYGAPGALHALSAATGAEAWACAFADEALVEVRGDAAYAHRAASWSRLRLA